MTYQKPSEHYDDNADADESSSLFLTATDASPSSLLRQEVAVVAKKKKLVTVVAVGVAGILLLVVAGGYSVVVAPAATAPANTVSTETIAELSVDVDNPSVFGTCVTPEGTFDGWSCDSKHGTYPYVQRDGCYNNNKYLRTHDDGAFETCYGLGSPNGHRCWSKSRYSSSWRGWYPCVPRDVFSDFFETLAPWFVALPLPDGSCGKPCNYGFNEAIYKIQFSDYGPL